MSTKALKEGALAQVESAFGLGKDKPRSARDAHRLGLVVKSMKARAS